MGGRDLTWPSRASAHSFAIAWAGLDAHLAAAGFTVTVTERFGSWDGAAFDPERSRGVITVARVR